MPRCHVCGVDEQMAFRCTYCGRVHCARHRLPESHDCPEIELAAQARRELTLGGGSGVREAQRVTVAGPSAIDRLFRRVEGKLAFSLLGAMVATFVLQYATLGALGEGWMIRIFVLDSSWVLKPWTLVTSIFAHGGFSHLFFNGLIMFFFGPLLERRIGAKRFAMLWFGAGVLAGLAQVHVFGQLLLHEEQAVIGASGALMGVAGALALLAPGMRVLLMFIIPVPMWALVGMYAFFDVAGAVSGYFEAAAGTGAGGGVAHVAHLAGLALGLWFGWTWRQQGMKFPGQMGHAFGAGRRGGL